jgi:cysteine sulfinate desulfinase/cysteine desulfurase-like protein
MGFDAAHASSTLRFSLSRMNTRDEVMAAAAEVIRAASHILEQRDAHASPVEFA